MSKILIVEDNAESRYMLESLLEAKGHEIITAEHGEEALRLARQDPPEVIISDIMMPVMNGFRLCREVKNNSRLRTIPFIFYTATFVEKADEKLAMSLGASRFIIKPTEGEQFIQILDEVLDEHRHRTLPVPEKQLEADDTLLEMYDHSVTRKLAETVEKLQKERKALLGSELRLKEAQEIAQMGHWKLDLRTNSLYWSDETYRIFGLKPKESDASYEAFLAAIHPEDRAFVNQAYQESLVKKTQYDIDHRLLLKDGTIKYVQERCQTLYDDDGQPIYSMGTVQDITERKLAEEDRVKLETAIEQTAESIVITDRDGNIQYANPSFVQISGYSRKEVIGKNPSVLQSGKHDTAFYREMWSTLTSGKVWKGHLINKKKNGGLFEEEATISPVFDKGGNIINYVAVKRDITKEMETAQKLQQAQKMESIGTLAGGIAHDFNNILFPILGYTEMLLQDIPEDSPFKDSLDKIYSAALRAKDLVKQILTFSRQEKSELKLMKMQPIIKEALKLIRSSIPTTIEIKQDIGPACGVIKADPTQIHQIIMNLATNAYHAMEETGGELKVSLKEVEIGVLDLINRNMEPGTYICLIVADTGMGMPNHVLGKIFDPFFTTKSKDKGTGMGLSVVHGIVNSIGGAIQAYSEPGKGTEFKVYFPVEKSSFEKQNIQAKEPMQGGTEQILIVDDEGDIITMEKLILERLGYQVTSCTSSIEAFEVFRDSPDKFDLVITDMTMPNMTGDRLSAELIKIRPDIPILLCTGFSETMSEEKAASLGIKDFLLKPIVMKDLSQKIREVLDKK